MKKLLFIHIFIIFSCAIFGQEADERTGILFGEQKKTKSYPLLSRLSLEFNFIKPTFYSNSFLENIDNGIIEYTFGWSSAIKVSLKNILIINGTYSQTYYKSPIVYENFVFETIDLGGAFILPYLNNKIFKPFIGIGYQFSKIRISDNRKDLSQSILTVGFNVIPYKYIYLVGEYKQSIDFSEAFPYNIFIIGIGVTY